MTSHDDKSPIKNRIGGVFIPVRNLEKAKEWYRKILGLEGEKNILDIYSWYP